MTTSKKTVADRKLLEGFGRGLKDIVVALANHPTILCLGLMAGSTVVRAVIPPSSGGHEHRDRIRQDMANLYSGAQSSLQILAVVQVIPAITSASASAIKSMYGGSAGAVPVPP